MELAQSLQGIPAAAAQRGEALGAQVAAEMLADRANDGSGNTMTYTPGSQPGEWRPDPLHPTQSAYTPDWGSVTPFVIQIPDQYQVPPPPALTSKAYTNAFDYLKAIGGDGVITPTIRTPEQTLIGNFWSYDGSPGIGTPTVEYNQITGIIAQQEGNTVMQNARLFALVNLAMADAAIVSWDTKYTYNFWRPVAAIREADPGTGPSGLGDGNPNTKGDPSWTPLGGAMDNGNPNGPNYTPAFPAYTSGHAALGAAMFQVVADFYGTNNISFSWMSDEYDGHTVDPYGFVRPEVTRHYAMLSQAMYENAQSRIYLGIHWPWDRDGGLQQGTEVGNYVFQNALLPLSGPTPAVVHLPLTPQQGTFASLGDAVRGIGFEVTEPLILRVEHAVGQKNPKGPSGPAGDPSFPGQSSESLESFLNGIHAPASPGFVGDSIATALSTFLLTPTVGAGLPATPAPVTQPAADASAFQMIDAAGEGWRSIQALQQLYTAWVKSAVSSTEQGVES